MSFPMGLYALVCGYGVVEGIYSRIFFWNVSTVVELLGNIRSYCCGSTWSGYSNRMPNGAAAVPTFVDGLDMPLDRLGLISPRKTLEAAVASYTPNATKDRSIDPAEKSMEAMFRSTPPPSSMDPRRNLLTDLLLLPSLEPI